jgi:integrase
MNILTCNSTKNTQQYPTKNKGVNVGAFVREHPKGSGKYHIVISQDKKRTERFIGTKDQAEMAAREVRKLLNLGQFQFPTRKKKKRNAADSLTFAEFFYIWQETEKPRLKSSTYIDYCGVVNNHLMPFFGNEPLEEIQRDNIKKFLSDKLKSKNNKDEHTHSYATIKKIKRVLSTILSEAVESSQTPITSNPVNSLSKYLNQCVGDRVETEEVEPWNKKELNIFLSAIKKLHPRYYAFFFTAVRAGLREGELVGLQPHDIDFHNMELHVRRSVTGYKLTSTKNKRSRRVEMSPDLAEVFRAWLVERKKETLKNGWKNEPKWLFYNGSGNWVDPSNVRDRVFYKTISKTKELRRIRIHDLRHTWVSLLIDLGADPKYICDQAGHSSIKVTMDIYGHLYKRKTGKRFVDKLDGSPVGEQERSN